MKSVLNVSVNHYKTVTERRFGKPAEYNLLAWLQSPHAYPLQHRVIEATLDGDADAKASAKMGLEVVEVSRFKDNHTGLICLDLDDKDNQTFERWNDMPAVLSEYGEIAYVGRSCSRTGWMVIIPIAYPDRHLEHFKALEETFSGGLGLTIDPACKDVKRLRFYAYDPTAYYNHSAILWSDVKLDEPKKYTLSQHEYTDLCTVTMLQEQGFSFFQDNGRNIHFTRPDKATGVSVSYNKETKLLYAFTSSTALPEGKWMKPISVYAYLYHAGDFDAAVSALRQRRAC